MMLKVTDVAEISKTTLLKVSLELKVDGEKKMASCIVKKVTMKNTVWYELKSVKPKSFYSLVHKYQERIFCALST